MSITALIVSIYATLNLVSFIMMFIVYEHMVSNVKWIKEAKNDIDDAVFFEEVELLEGNIEKADGWISNFRSTVFGLAGFQATTIIVLYLDKLEVILINPLVLFLVVLGQLIITYVAFNTRTKLYTVQGIKHGVRRLIDASALYNNTFAVMPSSLRRDK